MTAPSPLQLIANHPGNEAGIQLYMKRDDLLHPTIAGNKWRKLEPVVQLIQDQRFAGILTYGGPFSNHLQAVAAAGRHHGFPTVGVVRGLAADLSNPTLSAAQADGMQLFPVSKQAYDRRENAAEWLERFPQYYQLPEGGATPLATENCRRVATEIRSQLPDLQGPLIVCVPAGTGCTAAGVAAGLDGTGSTWIFPAVNYGVEEADIDRYLADLYVSDAPDVRFIRNYTFGGFAVHRPELLDFVRRFRAETGILLDPIYTSKMLFGVYDLLEIGLFPTSTTVVALHTGGLQGWAGFQQRFGVVV